MRRRTPTTSWVIALGAGAVLALGLVVGGTVPDGSAPSPVGSTVTLVPTPTSSPGPPPVASR